MGKKLFLRIKCYSLFLDGLEKGINDKARERAIVVHGTHYADPAVLKGQQRLGRSLEGMHPNLPQPTTVTPCAKVICSMWSLMSGDFGLRSHSLSG